MPALKSTFPFHGMVKAPGSSTVKVISMLLCELPGDYEYRVVFMLRDMGEILASQKEMLKRRGTAGADSGDAAMTQHFGAHLEKVRAWLAARKNFRVLYCEHRELLRAPAEQARRVEEFLGCSLDEQAMVQAIDPALHRNRAGDVRRA